MASQFWLGLCGPFLDRNGYAAEARTLIFTLMIDEFASSVIGSLYGGKFFKEDDLAIGANDIERGCT